MHRNTLYRGKYLPYAWDMSRMLGTGLSMRDEKIGCYKEKATSAKKYAPFGQATYYISYFRKDENSLGEFSKPISPSSLKISKRKEKATL